jgi:exosortase H (IPTLxxWG-CTERM-specific)
MAKRKRSSGSVPGDGAAVAPRKEREEAPSPPAAGEPRRRRLRPEARFLVVFLLVLASSFAVLAWTPVNDHVVEPFTGGVASASAVALRAIGQPVVQSGTTLRTPRFAVNIRNGCNGIEAMVILLAAIVSFPAPWRARLVGLGLGTVAIQIVNLVRVVALFLTGAYLPRFFDTSHTVVWQSLVILVAVLTWILWAQRVVPRRVPAA